MLQIHLRFRRMAHGEATISLSEIIQGKSGKIMIHAGVPERQFLAVKFDGFRIAVFFQSHGSQFVNRLTFEFPALAVVSDMIQVAQTFFRKPAAVNRLQCHRIMIEQVFILIRSQILRTLAYLRKKLTGFAVFPFAQKRFGLFQRIFHSSHENTPSLDNHSLLFSSIFIFAAVQRQRQPIADISLTAPAAIHFQKYNTKKEAAFPCFQRRQPLYKMPAFKA